jgi:hypothetical protein
MMRVLKCGFTLGVLVFIMLSQACREAEPPPRDFDVDVGSSEIPYIVIDTRGAEIQFEPKTPATLNVYERKNLVQESITAAKHPTGFPTRRATILRQPMEPGRMWTFHFLAFRLRKTGD